MLAFNWKMNPETLREAIDLASISDCKNAVVIPPFLFIEEVGKILKKAKLGAQDLFWENPSAGKGAFTGEVSAKELKNFCVEYVIVGHSDRRHKLGESDEVVAKKLKTALVAGLIPILCVGETREEKEFGKRKEVIKRQLNTALANLKPKIKNLKLIVAYEPVWAIGAGDPETPGNALEAIKYIKKLLAENFNLKVKVLYGGSVNSKILGDYLKYKEINGALVGGASLKKDEVEKMTQWI